MGLLAVVGVIKGVYEFSTEVRSTPMPMHRSPEVFHTEWTSESGFLEYYRSKGIRAGEKGLKAGYATCSDLAILGMEGTYAELRKLGTKEQSDQLLYASVHYLCTEFEAEYDEGSVGK